MDPAELHDKVQAAFNAGDLDALIDVYEPDARMLQDDGSVVEGVDAIGTVWSEFLGLGGRIDGVAVASAVTAEVARRQPDRSWRSVIDNPYGAPAAAPE